MRRPEVNRPTSGSASQQCHPAHRRLLDNCRGHCTGTRRCTASVACFVRMQDGGRRRVTWRSMCGRTGRVLRSIAAPPAAPRGRSQPERRLPPARRAAFFVAVARGTVPSARGHYHPEDGAAARPQPLVRGKRASPRRRQLARESTTRGRPRGRTAGALAACGRPGTYRASGSREPRGDTSSSSERCSRLARGRRPVFAAGLRQTPPVPPPRTAPFIRGRLTRSRLAGRGRPRPTGRPSGDDSITRL